VSSEVSTSSAVRLPHAPPPGASGPNQRRVNSTSPPGETIVRKSVVGSANSSPVAPEAFTRRSTSWSRSRSRYSEPSRAKSCRPAWPNPERTTTPRHLRPEFRGTSTSCCVISRLRDQKDRLSARRGIQRRPAVGSGIDPETGRQLATARREAISNTSMCALFDRLRSRLCRSRPALCRLERRAASA